MRFLWLLLFALCFSLPANARGNAISNSDSGQSRPRQSQPEQSKSAQPIFPVTVQRDIQRIARTLETESQNKNAKAENDRAERDVAAQEQIARWAIPMFVLGIIEILITGVGVGLVRRTILESRRATEDDIRPYVQISRCKFQRIPGIFRMIVTVSNGGHTPATFFEVHFKARAIRSDDKSWQIPKDDLTSIRWNALGGSDKVTVGVSHDEFSAVAQTVSDSGGEMAFFLLGKIVYGDIWGGVYETEFAYFTHNITQTQRVSEGGTMLKKQYRKMSRAPGKMQTFLPMS
jgi:hypothetical protein